MTEPINAPPSPWDNLNFEPKVNKLNVASGTDADVLKALLDDQDTMPWETITLPSCGLYYGAKIPGGVVQVRPMGIDTDKILATQRLAQSGKALDYLFKKCIKFPNEFDPLDLLAGDRTFILYYLRGITHGNMYEYAHECPNKECGLTSTHTYDMNNLVSKIQGPKNDLGDEPFRIELPYLSKSAGRPVWVKVRLLRGSDVQRMVAQLGVKARMRRDIDAKGEPIGLDETISQNMYDVITEVMGDKNPATIKKIVDKLHSMDSATIRTFLSEAAPGIDATIDTTCTTCGNVTRMELPITESFFRPSKPVGLAKG